MENQQTEKKKAGRPKLQLTEEEKEQRKRRLQDKKNNFQKKRFLQGCAFLQLIDYLEQKLGAEFIDQIPDNIMQFSEKRL